MDEMMRGQRGWRELAILGDKMDKFTGLIEGLIWSPRGGYSNEHADEWAYEEVELCDDDDFLILACDGVWDCMSNQQLVDFINEQIETVSIYSLITFKQT
ncbi:hypothetical protein GW17_00005575 [Ensete ventricosum]|nr:hypothetical protein GW17_00005575 [Ensete ventricosum]RZS13085.1 hypothetical protein BHM03_00044613 [Ensete ventricosum]